MACRKRLLRLFVGRIVDGAAGVYVDVVATADGLLGVGERRSGGVVARDGIA